MSVRLTYFAGYGLAEQTRWLLAYANVPFSQRALASFSQFDELRCEATRIEATSLECDVRVRNLAVLLVIASN